MAVRWRSEDFLSGYGVVGGQKVNDTPLQNILIKDIAAEIPKPAFENNDPEGDAYIAHHIGMTWRLSLRYLAGEDEGITSYFSPLGKRKLGRMVYYAFEYASQEDLWSYDVQIFENQCAVFDYLNFELIDIDPCSEPQDDLPELFDLDRFPFPYSGSTPRYSSPINIADSILIYPEPSVSLYRWGITYDYTITAYTEAGLSPYAYTNSYIL